MMGGVEALEIDAPGDGGHTLTNMFKSRETTADVTFHLADNGVVSAHRVVLSAGSRYFHAMFNGQFQEASKDKFTFTDVPADAFEHLLEFLYTGSIRLSMDEVVDFCCVADRFTMPRAIDACRHKLYLALYYLPANSLLGFLCLPAALRAIVDPETRLLDVAGKRFREIAELDDFVCLEENVLISVIERAKVLLAGLLENAFVLAAVLRWWRGGSDRTDVDNLPQALAAALLKPGLASESSAPGEGTGSSTAEAGSILAERKATGKPEEVVVVGGRPMDAGGAGVGGGGGGGGASENWRASGWTARRPPPQTFRDWSLRSPGAANAGESSTTAGAGSGAGASTTSGPTSGGGPVSSPSTSTASGPAGVTSGPSGGVRALPSASAAASAAAVAAAHAAAHAAAQAHAAQPSPVSSDVGGGEDDAQLQHGRPPMIPHERSSSRPPTAPASEAATARTEHGARERRGSFYSRPPSRMDVGRRSPGCLCRVCKACFDMRMTPTIVLEALAVELRTSGVSASHPYSALLQKELKARVEEGKHMQKSQSGAGGAGGQSGPPADDLSPTRAHAAAARAGGVGAAALALMGGPNSRRRFASRTLFSEREVYTLELVALGRTLVFFVIQAVSNQPLLQFWDMDTWRLKKEVMLDKQAILSWTPALQTNSFPVDLPFRTSKIGLLLESDGSPLIRIFDTRALHENDEVIVPTHRGYANKTLHWLSDDEQRLLSVGDRGIALFYSSGEHLAFLPWVCARTREIRLFESQVRDHWLFGIGADYKSVTVISVDDFSVVRNIPLPETFTGICMGIPMRVTSPLREGELDCQVYIFAATDTDNPDSFALEVFEIVIQSDGAALPPAGGECGPGAEPQQIRRCNFFDLTYAFYSDSYNDLYLYVLPNVLCIASEHGIRRWDRHARRELEPIFGPHPDCFGESGMTLSRIFDLRSGKTVYDFNKDSMQFKQAFDEDLWINRVRVLGEGHIAAVFTSRNAIGPPFYVSVMVDTMQLSS
eukprot:Rmarinus@m.6520